MVEVPSLVSLCLDSLKKEIIMGECPLPPVFLLPFDLLDTLIMCSPPLVLWKLQNERPFEERHVEGYSTDHLTNKRKLGWDWNINTAWKVLFKLRWPDLAEQIQPTDWQQAYWETHLQNCLDEAAAIALVPSFNGYIGDIQIPDTILKHVGFLEHTNHSPFDHSKLSYHCLQFGSHARSLRLQNVLCTAETSDLLRECKLQKLVLRLIRSQEQIDGVCKLLNQHSKTLSSLEFVHCILSADTLNAICSSIVLNGVHGIQHFSINASSFRESGPFSLPSGLESFLSSGRSICSLKFSDNNLGRTFAKSLFLTLVNMSSTISVLDLSENYIAGWLSDFKPRSLSDNNSHLSVGKSLQLLRVLNLRGSSLRKDDAESLRYVLAQMPKLEDLDLSDNPIQDEGIMNLIPYFVEASDPCSGLASLKLENCVLSSDGVSRLLNAISTFEGQLKSLSVADNFLGSQVAEALATFMRLSVQVLDVGGVGLGSSGFQKLQDLMNGELELVKINISENRGGIEAAKFLSKLLSQAPKLTEVNASSNLMPIESLNIICSALKLTRGNIEHLDLSGHKWDYKLDHASLHAEIQRDWKHIVILPSSSPDSSALYDDDP